MSRSRTRPWSRPPLRQELGVFRFFFLRLIATFAKFAITPPPKTESTRNSKFVGSGPALGPVRARMRTRFAAQCSLHQLSTPQTDSSPISGPGDKVIANSSTEAIKLKNNVKHANSKSTKQNNVKNANSKSTNLSDSFAKHICFCFFEDLLLLEPPNTLNPLFLLLPSCQKPNTHLEESVLGNLRWSSFFWVLFLLLLAPVCHHDHGRSRTRPWSRPPLRSRTRPWPVADAELGVFRIFIFS